MQKCLTNVSNAYNICKNSGGGHVGSGSIAFYCHRIFAVALGRDEYHVVGAFELVEGMRTVDGAEPYLRFVGSRECGYVSLV